VKGQIFSGVQPTGNLHLGNYLGAIKQWVKLQDDYNCMFCIVDMHAITMPQDPAALRQSTREMAAAYIASGINPDNAVIYNQSMVKEHAELAWILGCNTPMGWLNRMTQFKDKAGKNKENAPLGLFSYPVLMAADILLFNATHVPVGEDQKQHLELTRDIAESFNHHFKTDAFTVPEPLIQGDATRVMSLADGKSKMSKSDPSEKSRINMTDDEETIRKKFKKAKADMGFDSIYFDKDNRPEISNLLTIYSALTGESLEATGSKFKDYGNGDFKAAIADAAVTELAPIAQKMRELLAAPADLDDILADGARKASAKAAENLARIKDIVGFLQF
jgi:tryptophanyl-tRNA synthetase